VDRLDEKRMQPHLPELKPGVHAASLDAERIFAA
jgi:hypothetical protein